MNSGHNHGKRSDKEVKTSFESLFLLTRGPRLARIPLARIPLAQFFKRIHIYLAYTNSAFNRVYRVGSAKGFRTIYNCTQYIAFVLLLYFLNAKSTTIFERASEIFSCKPNKYGSF